MGLISRCLFAALTVTSFSLFANSLQKIYKDISLEGSSPDLASLTSVQCSKYKENPEALACQIALANASLTREEYELSNNALKKAKNYLTEWADEKAGAKFDELFAEEKLSGAANVAALQQQKVNQQFKQMEAKSKEFVDSFDKNPELKSSLLNCYSNIYGKTPIAEAPESQQKFAKESGKLIQQFINEQISNEELQHKLKRLVIVSTRESSSSRSSKISLQKQATDCFMSNIGKEMNQSMGQLEIPSMLELGVAQKRAEYAVLSPKKQIEFRRQWIKEKNQILNSFDSENLSQNQNFSLSAASSTHGLNLSPMLSVKNQMNEMYPSFDLVGISLALSEASNAFDKGDADGATVSLNSALKEMSILLAKNYGGNLANKEALKQFSKRLTFFNYSLNRMMESVKSSSISFAAPQSGILIEFDQQFGNKNSLAVNALNIFVNAHEGKIDKGQKLLSEFKHTYSGKNADLAYVEAKWYLTVIEVLNKLPMDGQQRMMTLEHSWTPYLEKEDLTKLANIHEEIIATSYDPLIQASQNLYSIVVAALMKEQPTIPNTIRPAVDEILSSSKNGSRKESMTIMQYAQSSFEYVVLAYL